MGPCIVNIFQYMSNKMQRYTLYFIWKLLYTFPGGTTTHHQERRLLYLQHLVCHTVTAICRYRGRVGIGLSVL
jgi:23S rRNA maturation-related 3'-5' exoribonuclease YhaM